MAKEKADPFVTIKIRKSTRRLLNILAAQYEMPSSLVLGILVATDGVNALLDKGKEKA